MLTVRATLSLGSQSAGAIRGKDDTLLSVERVAKGRRVVVSGEDGINITG
jgi:hypothetical protein